MVDVVPETHLHEKLLLHKLAADTGLPGNSKYEARKF